jgi:flagellar motor switch protein FliN/FliY
MPNLRRVLNIEVPLVVRLAERQMTVGDVLDLAPGAMIHFNAGPDESLELLANGKVIARGCAVKVNERFGLRVERVARTSETVRALTHGSEEQPGTAA